MLASIYCVMDKKQYQKIKIGQVWKRQHYSSGIVDNLYVGDVYYLVTGKQSAGQWKLSIIHKDPKDLPIRYDYWSAFWVKGKEIRTKMEQVDPEPYKTAIVLYG